MTQQAKNQADRILYAVGDIHGCADLLAELEHKIVADWEHQGRKESLLIFLGDYVDRGPQSAKVIERLIEGFPPPSVHLRGNHEQILLDFLDDPGLGDLWRRNGGMETLASYGVDIDAIYNGGGFERAARDLKACLPAAHLSFLNGLKMWFQAGRYFFCHAGVRPGVPLEAQTADDLLWIREPFHSSHTDFGKIVVHGHTPVETADVRPNRINIDTGAVFSGKLTCLVMNGAATRFITT
ncbi:MAG: metallophosphoesterase family protein [Hyphomicrobiales bacterium]|nr:metallophosphoesterase family protein [Hyphomicrobiales bacterium]